jgi:hypothetical protein
MLGHPKERPLSDFIGQPIEVIVPNLPDRPAQAKQNWMPRALKNSELNFYLLMVTKTYYLQPVSYNLSLESDDSIKMRVRDMMELDALLTIDEVGNNFWDLCIGTLQSVNDDAFILLGHAPEDVVGRNIKYIQPPEVAEAHDGYLLRYI